MHVTFSTADGRVAALEVDAAEPIDNLRALLEVELGIPMDEQELYYNGRPLGDISKGLSAHGVAENDLVLVQRRAGRTAAGSSSGVATGVRGGARPGTARGRGGARRASAQRIDPAVYPSLTWDDVGGVDPNTLHAILQVNSGMMSHIQRVDPDLHTAASDPNPAKFRGLILTRNLERALPEAERTARLAQMEARLAANPFDVEAQRVIEEEIQRRNVEENRDLAFEHMPEAFARVHMLYIPAVINGTPMKVFVDSGAQMTILSKKCADQCGLLRLVDTRFAGHAVGVGRAAILGRVHMAPLVIAGQHFPCTFTIVDQDNMDCLLGLDMLKRFQCCIDLFKNVLRLRLESTEVEVPFLGEAEIPKDHLGADSMDEDAPAQSSGSSAPPTAASVASSAAGGAAGVAAAPAPAAAPPSAPASSAPAAPAPVPAPAPAVGGRSPAAPPAAQGSPLFAPIDLSALGGAAATPGRGRGRAPAPAPASTANETHVRVLMDMGYSREKSLRALEACNGNVEAAAALIAHL